MDFELLRFQPNADGTIHGCLLVINDHNIKAIYPTIENKQYKVQEGSFTMELNTSIKFNTRLPYLHIPGRKGIRIHYGTIKEHSNGCILLTDYTHMRLLKLRYLKPKTQYHIKILQL